MTGRGKSAASSDRKRGDHRTVPRPSWQRSTTARHIRNMIEGGNRSRGGACETIHHLFMAKKLKRYIYRPIYGSYSSLDKECIRILNGLERSLEKHLPEAELRWPPEHVQHPRRCDTHKRDLTQRQFSNIFRWDYDGEEGKNLTQRRFGNQEYEVDALRLIVDP